MIFVLKVTVQQVNKKIERKMKIENLTICMNCVGFVNCKEEMKEDIVDCDHFEELLDDEQVVVVNLNEWSNKVN
jgi:hypothetical protein